jgi:hypothetical protein
MRSKLAVLCLGLLCFGAGCATDGDDARTRQAQETDGAEPDATNGAAASPEADENGDENGERVEAPAEVNRPREGTYVYSYASESTNASAPNATPQRAPEGAELTSKVTQDGDIITTEEKASTGPAVATARWRWSDDRAVELSHETKSPRGTAGCRFEEPIEMLHFPMKVEEFETQNLDGEGTSCNGTRDVAVEGTEEVEDEDGKAWPTWRVRYESQARGMGFTNRTTVVRWFSPELGKDVKTETTSELIDESDKVTQRGESTSVLKAYPS